MLYAKSALMLLAGLLSGLLTLSFMCSPVQADELMVYTSRKPTLLMPVLAAYSRETGIKVRYVTGEPDELIKRLAEEGAGTKADLFMTVDAGNLWLAAREGLLKPVASKVLEKNVPEYFRDSAGRWFGISMRARTIVYSTERLKPSALSTYEDLADNRWKGRLCLRTSQKVYNQSMVSLMIADDGIKEAERVVRGWVMNLAQPSFDNDTKVMMAIQSGACDLGLVNTYYYGRLLHRNPNIPLALFWPNQKGHGAYVDVSGAGVVANSHNAAEAVRFLEWLTTEPAQRLFADANMEYPVNPAVRPHESVRAWGGFVFSKTNLSATGQHRQDAVDLMRRAGYE